VDLGCKSSVRESLQGGLGGASGFSCQVVSLSTFLDRVCSEPPSWVRHVSVSVIIRPAVLEGPVRAPH
jgi:hypothetical protein